MWLVCIGFDAVDWLGERRDTEVLDFAIQLTRPRSLCLNLHLNCYTQPLRRVQGLCAWDTPWREKKNSFNWISNCNSSVSLAGECESGTQTTRRHSSCEWMNWAWQSGVHRADVVEGGTLRTVLEGSLLAWQWLTETRWTRARHLANRYAPLQTLVLAWCDSKLYSFYTDAQLFRGLHCSSWDFMGTHNHLTSQLIKIHQIFSNYSKFSQIQLIHQPSPVSPSSTAQSSKCTPDGRSAIRSSVLRRSASARSRVATDSSSGVEGKVPGSKKKLVCHAHVL